jgi:hypothetical protein
VGVLLAATLLGMATSAAAVPPRPSAGDPFGDVRVDVGLALTAAFAAGALLLGTDLWRVPWLHVLTLGVLTPLIVAFSQHQAETVLHVRPRPRHLLRALLSVGVLGVAVGLTTRTTAAVGAGAAASSAAVLLSWWRLRSARRRAIGPRFGWLVRGYERAHGAFLHGALLGALLGIGVVPGWAYGAVRLAHLHAMLLGFAAVTLLATVVLYGPTLLRAQLEAGVDDTAPRWLRRAATAASVAVLALLATSAPAGWDIAARAVAALALITTAIGAAHIAAPLVRTVLRKGSRAPAGGILVTAAVCWLAVVLLADAVVVLLGAYRWHDALGVALLVGALGQAIVATLLHVVTLWLPRRRRLALVPRIDAAPRWLLALPQVAVVVAVLAVAL